jgi:vacuolar-type H+-ATPase subunit I/STV1
VTSEAKSINSSDAVKFAKIVYWSAAIWGVVIITPLYFIINVIGVKDPPPITHPLFYYGFAGTALAWQAAFMIIATCPSRYRQMMIATIIEKFTYGAAAFVLYFQHRLQRTDLSFGVIDLVFLVLFTLAYLKTPATID